MSSSIPITKLVDSKGRITLGKSFANKVVIIKDLGDEVFIRLGRVIPESESWLYESKEALTMVREGLSQAQNNEFASGPDLSAAQHLADQLKDD